MAIVRADDGEMRSPPDRIVHWLPADPPAAGRRCTASQTAGRRARVACTSVRVQAHERQDGGHRRGAPRGRGIAAGCGWQRARERGDPVWPPQTPTCRSRSGLILIQLGRLGRRSPGSSGRVHARWRGWPAPGVGPERAWSRQSLVVAVIAGLRIEGGRLVTAGPRGLATHVVGIARARLLAYASSSHGQRSSTRFSRDVSRFRQGRMYRSTQDRTNPRSRRSCLATSSPGRRRRRGPGRDERGLVADEEGDGVRDLLGRAEAAERRPVRDLVLEVLGQVLRQLGQHEPRRDGVDGDAARRRARGRVAFVRPISPAFADE